MDPLAGTPWSSRSTVEGFAKGSPNAVLVEYAGRVLAGGSGSRALDIGCGAGRNGVPLARLGWRVFGVDLSLPMLNAARARCAAELRHGRFDVALASMDLLPVSRSSVDLIVAHGIWNLARSGADFRRAVREAARVARAGAALFVFTFSRHTLPDDARPVEGEAFVFTQFSGHPQVFLTREQLISEMRDAGFERDEDLPLNQCNRPAPGQLTGVGGPVIYEAAFRLRIKDSTGS